MKHAWILAVVLAVGVVLVRHGGASPAIAVGSDPPRHATRHSARHAAPSVGSMMPLVVYVAGAVARPGLYRLAAGARADDAVVKAGGLLKTADAAAVNLAAHVNDGDEIRVPRVGETVPRARAPRTRAVRKRPPPPFPVELNSADANQLQTLPGVGATLAQRIIAFRETAGPFSSVDDLLDVAGMTQRRLDAIAPFLRVDGAP